MASSQLLYGFMKGLHDIFTVLWIGSLFIAGLVVMPILKQNLEKGPLLKNLMDCFQSRLRRLFWISLVGLFLTGMYLARLQAEFPGLFKFGNRYSTVLSIKMMVAFVMVGVMILRSRLLKKPREEYQKIPQSLMTANMVLGLIVLFLSGLLSV